MRPRLKDFFTLNATVVTAWLFIAVLHLIRNDASCTFLCRDFSECSFNTMNCFWKAAMPSLYVLILANTGWVVAMLVKRLRREA